MASIIRGGIQRAKYSRHGITQLLYLEGVILDTRQDTAGGVVNNVPSVLNRVVVLEVEMSHQPSGALRGSGIQRIGFYVHRRKRYW